MNLYTNTNTNSHTLTTASSYTLKCNFHRTFSCVLLPKTLSFLLSRRCRLNSSLITQRHILLERTKSENV